jgi:hypothetical protein
VPPGGGALNYYNDYDPYCAEWLRNLIEVGLIQPGTIDHRHIRGSQRCRPRGFAQLHLFAGIAGWPKALELAAWPIDADAPGLIRRISAATSSASEEIDALLLLTTGAIRLAVLQLGRLSC